MSLTRDEWIELWRDIKVIEKKLQDDIGRAYNGSIYAHIIYRTKVKIQQVTGQME